MKAYNASGTLFNGEFVPAKGPGRPLFSYVETDAKGTARVLRFGGLGKDVKLFSHKKLRNVRQPKETPKGAYMRLIKGRK